MSTTPPYFGSEIEQTVSAIGAKVAKARAERGWSLQQLAKRSGLSPASIHKIEAGERPERLASCWSDQPRSARALATFAPIAETVCSISEPK